MAIDKKNIFLKTVKYLGITFGSILVVLFLTPIIFSDTIKEEVKIPVKFVGLGEKMTDLIPIDIESYIYGLVKDLM